MINLINEKVIYEMAKNLLNNWIKEQKEKKNQNEEEVDDE